MAELSQGCIEFLHKHPHYIVVDVSRLPTISEFINHGKAQGPYNNNRESSN